MDTKDKRIRLRPETAAKFRAIARHHRWTDTETADALADFYLSNNRQIPVQKPAKACVA